MALANDDIQAKEGNVSGDSSRSLTDADVSTLRTVGEEVANEQTKELQTSLDGGIESVNNHTDESVSKIVSDALAADSLAKAGTTQVVTIDSEQWQGVLDHMQFERDSLSLQNALLLFSLMLMAALIGMRFFSEFSRGFRHG